jgi:hypothetical protein
MSTQCRRRRECRSASIKNAVPPALRQWAGDGYWTSVLGSGKPSFVYPGARFRRDEASTGVSAS